jgi:radical SAM superfamily enzyme YgiQ (UPF0313 family)
MNILAINPWIYDFAAYDFWLKPYGFLVILSYLKNKGIHIDYIDCLKKDIPGTFGRGKYHIEIIDKPAIFKSIPRYYKRYGITIAEFRNCLKNKNPDYILITSSMTYWYPAIKETINLLKEKFPSVPVILGGTYATLCYEHAKQNINCDFVFKNDSLKYFFKIIGIDYNYEELYSTLPVYEDFYKSLEYLVLRTSWGCPFSCSYCAIKELFAQFYRLKPQKVIDYILKYAKDGIKDFVLYDDALLYEPEYIKIILNAIVKLNLNIRFHTPNAIHLRFLDEEIAVLLKKAGFTNPHFGLETVNPGLQKLWGDKVNRQDLIRGVELLKSGGFKAGEFSLYLLLGYPNQDLTELRQDVDFLHSLGSRVSLAEFSPVPGTKIFQEYGEEFSEPLLHNNSVFGFFQKDKLKELWEIKNYVRQLNKKFL